MNASQPPQAATDEKSYRINIRRRNNASRKDQPSARSGGRPIAENVVVAASDKLDAIERCLDQYPDIRRGDIASVVFVPG